MDRAALSADIPFYFEASPCYCRISAAVSPRISVSFRPLPRPGPMDDSGFSAPKLPETRARTGPLANAGQRRF